MFKLFFNRPLGFPEKEARQAATGFGHVLMNLQKYKDNNKAKLENRRLVLLLHSMGNIVFEEFMRSYNNASLPKELFDVIVLSSSASATKDHAVWLMKVDFSRQLYVTVNENDTVLTAGGMHEIKGLLGKKLETMFAGKVTLAANAVYVNFDKTGVNHRYFFKSGQEGNPYIKKFFEVVIVGNTFNFNGFDGIKKVEERNAKVFHFKKH